MATIMMVVKVMKVTAVASFLRAGRLLSRRSDFGCLHHLKWSYPSTLSFGFASIAHFASNT
jgi:hypothetical protein